MVLSNSCKIHYFDCQWIHFTMRRKTLADFTWNGPNSVSKLRLYCPNSSCSKCFGCPLWCQNLQFCNFKTTFPTLKEMISPKLPLLFSVLRPHFSSNESRTVKSPLNGVLLVRNKVLILQWNDLVWFIIIFKERMLFVNGLSYMKCG